MRGILICGLCLWAAITRADTHYVAQAGQTPSGTYLDWPSAASNIQDAIDVASAATFDTVLVSNGIYSLTNQILVTNGITVQGFNGKLSTFVNGNYPTYSNRCFYLSNSAAVVDGFTITNGCLRSDNWYGGGVRIYAGTMRNCSIISNTLAGNSAGNGCPGVYMDSSSCVLSNCLVALNCSTGRVGGVYVGGSRVDGCNIVSNSAYNNGGIVMGSGTIINSTSAWNRNIPGGNYGVGLAMSGGLVSNCLIRTNYGGGYGGGIYAIRMDGGMLRDSVVKDKTFNEDFGLLLVAGNVANCTFTKMGQGIDVRAGTVSNCTIAANSPYGGVNVTGSGIVRNCLVTSNANYEKGSGVKINTGGSVENCTIVNNLNYTAVYVGASGGTLKNCIIYSNTSGNWSNANPSTASYTNCCTTPTNDLPGSGNITNNPAFVNSGAGDYHLVANSPCINQGLNQAWMTDALDFDGKRRVDKYSGRVDMGCYEFLLRGTLFGFH